MVVFVVNHAVTVMVVIGLGLLVAFHIADGVVALVRLVRYGRRRGRGR